MGFAGKVSEGIVPFPAASGNLAIALRARFRDEVDPAEPLEAGGSG